MTTATTLTNNATEESTYIVSVAFLDEDSVSVTPDSDPTWSLYDANGDVVNDRNGVTITAASTINIVLSGDDLALVDGDSVERKLLVEAVYTSSLGAGLPLKVQASFEVDDLVGIS